MNRFRFLYNSAEFLFLSATSFIIFMFLMKKVKKKFEITELLYSQKKKDIEKLVCKLHYKQDLLMEKKKDLEFQEQLFSSKMAEMERQYHGIETGLHATLDCELDEYKKTCFREVDTGWQDKIKKMLYTAILVKK